MTESLVSIVIPVYNVEKYLDRCMASIVHQTYRNLEIILVDDGSPDSCPEKCEDWARKDSRIKVIHKTNAGLGMARNSGIENATGTYICFFDSDDYVALTTVEKAVSLAEKNHSDIVLFGMTEVDANGEIKGVYTPYTEKDCYMGSEVLDFVLPNMIKGSSVKGQHFGLNMSSCTCLFSLRLITAHNWRFVSEREYISEDYYSLLELYQHVHNVSIMKQACYYYCYNNTSLTHSYRPDRYERICQCYRAMMEMCRRLCYPKQIGSSLASQYIGNVIGAMKMVVRNSGSSYWKKRRQLQEMITEQTLRNALCEVDLKMESKGRKVLLYSIKTGSVLSVYCQIKVKLLLARER